MKYVISAVVGAMLCSFLWTVLKCWTKRTRRLTKGSEQGSVHSQVGHKLEVSKILLFCVMLTYFIGLILGAYVVLEDPSQLGTLLVYIGTPTAVTIGFYSWKAKAENVIRMKKDNPVETADTDFTSMQP